MNACTGRKTREAQSSCCELPTSLARFRAVAHRSKGSAALAAGVALIVLADTIVSDRSLGRWAPWAVRIVGLVAAMIGGHATLFGDGPPVGARSRALQAARAKEGKTEEDVDSAEVVSAASKDEQAAAYKPVPFAAELLIVLYFAELTGLVWVFRHDWNVDWDVMDAALGGDAWGAVELANRTSTAEFVASADGDRTFVLRALGLPFPLLVVAMIAVMGAFVEVAKSTCAEACLRVSRVSVAVGMAEEPKFFASPLDNPMTMKKFKEQSWQMSIHLLMAAVEWYLVTYEHPRGSLMGDLFLELPWHRRPAAHSLGNPMPEVQFRPSQALVALYAAQLAVWVYTGFVCAFVDERRKDFLVMMAHHVVTIALVGFSAAGNDLCIGLMILYIHDFSDVFVDGLKMSNYLALDGLKGLFIVEGSFAACLSAWVYFRLYQYPLKCMQTAILGSVAYSNNPAGAGPGDDRLWANVDWVLGRANDPGTPAPAPLATRLLDNGVPNWLGLSLLLVVLQALHIWWFALLVRLAYRVATTSDASENRQLSEEGYEGRTDAKTEELASAKRKTD